VLFNVDALLQIYRLWYHERLEKITNRSIFCV